MIHVYRTSNARYNPLDFSGAKRVGGRWNSIGLGVLYTSENSSTAILERLAHITIDDFKDLDINSKYHVYKISISVKTDDIYTPVLETNWKSNERYCQMVGDEWFIKGTHPVLKIPSAINPIEFNYLINPLMISPQKMRVIETYPLEFDERLKI